MSAATDRLVQYNGGRYHPVDNQYGLDGTGGLDANMVRLLTDMATAANDTATGASQVASDKVLVAQYKTDTYDYMVAAETAATNAQTWDPALYVKKDGSTAFTGQVTNNVGTTPAFYTPWAGFGSATAGAANGAGYFSSNLHWNGANWVTTVTHGSIGAMAILFNYPTWGDVSVAKVTGATVAGAVVTPTITSLWHAGNLIPDTAGTANTIAKRGSDGSVTASKSISVTAPGGGASDTSILSLGSNSDALDAYFQMNSSTNTTAPAGARGCALVVNTGAFGIYTGRLSPAVQFYMDPTTKQFTFYKGVNPSPVTVPFSSTITLDFASSNRFDLTATGSFTLANPSNMKPGQVVVLNVTNSTANNVMSRGSAFKTKGGNGVSLSTAAGSRDKVIIECISAGVADITIQKDWK